MIARNYGKTQKKLEFVADQLKLGRTVLWATQNETAIKAIVHTLKVTFDLDVKAEPNYYTTPMKLVYDPNDFSAEPGIIGFDFGEKKLFGYNLTKQP